jgi:two-component system, OmpR family, sensor kinase
MRPFPRLGLVSRLVLLISALLIICCAAVGVATTLGLRTYLQNRLDQELSAAGIRYSLSLEHPGDGDVDDANFSSTVGQTAGTLGARLKNGQVTAIGVVDSGREYPSPDAADRAAIATLPVSASPHTVQLPHLGRYRVSVTAGRDGDVLVTGLPTTPVDGPIHELVITEVGFFAGAIVITALLGFFSVRRSLGPLQRIAMTARRVSALPLASGSVRLPEQVPNLSPRTEIGDVTDAFNHMLGRVQDALEVRHADEEKLRQFIADASHELRTPVAVISSHAEYAQREPAAASEALSRIRAEAGRMGHMVDDLLLLARLDSGRELVAEPLDLTRLVLDAVTDISRTAPSHIWRLDLDEDPTQVVGDANALHQAVANLLINVRAHTPPGTTVDVRLVRRAGAVDVSVRDDGPGLAHEFLPHAFDRFARGDSARARTEGAGLGLAITNAIVLAHRGRLDASSEPGTTVFTITLPSD